MRVFFFKLRNVDSSVTVLLRTQCEADAVMEVGGRGTTWLKTVLLEGLFTVSPACCCLPVVQWKQRCSLPPFIIQLPLFMNIIWFGLTYFISLCRSRPLTENVSGQPLKLINIKTMYKPAFACQIIYSLKQLFLSSLYEPETHFPPVRKRRLCVKFGDIGARSDERSRSYIRKQSTGDLAFISASILQTVPL